LWKEERDRKSEKWRENSDKGVGPRKRSLKKGVSFCFLEAGTSDSLMSPHSSV